LSSKQRVCEACYTKTVTVSELVNEEDNIHGETIEGLKRLYRSTIKPLEIQYRFDKFYSPILCDADFDAAPMILLMGAYSVGKSTFIRHLIRKDYPGIRIGAEPTTDRFTIISGTHSGDTVIPGNTLVVQADRPFNSLQKFGAGFLNKLECSLTDADILHNLTFVDSPGILSGSQEKTRDYDYTGVIEWFAGRCDRILLLFDAHKLDISDELQSAIGALRGHEPKIRVVLNKADTVDSQQLMRVHGALMWSLGKIIRTPEVMRVYVGSFWDKKQMNSNNADFFNLFKKEEGDLFDDLQELPSSSIVRKVNELIKRLRAAKTHALIIDHLRTKLPYFSQEKALRLMLNNLEEEYKEVARVNNVPLGDFPRPATFKASLQIHAGNDLSLFPPLNPHLIADINVSLASLLPRLLSKYNNKTTGKKEAKPVAAPIDDDTLAIWKEEFRALDPDDGLLSGAQLRDFFIKSGLGTPVLKKVWSLADHDQDGFLNENDFITAKRLIKMVLNGEELPSTIS